MMKLDIQRFGYIISETTVESNVNNSANTSDVTVTLKGTSTGSFKQNTPCSITIDGTVYNSTVNTTTSDNNRVLMTRTKTVTHNTDGSKTVGYEIGLDMTGTSAGFLALGGNKILTKIPRASYPTLVDFIIPNAFTIVTNRASENFTHTLTLKIAGATILTRISVGASVTITPSESEITALYTALANAYVLPYTLVTQTYDGATLIGTTENMANCFVNEALNVPTFTTFTYEEDDSTVLTLTSGNKYIKNFSNVKTTISSANKAVGQNSATIVKYIMTIGSQTTEALYSTGDVTLTIANIDNSTVTIQAVDSRGLRTTVSYILPYLEYTVPTIGSASTQREDGIGTTTYLALQGTIYNGNFGNGNNIVKYFGYRVKGINDSWDAQTWYDITASFNAKVTNTNGVLSLDFSDLQELHENGTSGGFTQGTRFDVQFNLSDGISTQLFNNIIGSSSVLDGKFLDSNYKDTSGNYHIGLGGLPHEDFVVNITTQSGVGAIAVDGVAFSGGGGTGAVDSVNGQTGTVVLDADDISDSATTNKFLSATQKTDLTDGGASTLHKHSHTNMDDIGSNTHATIDSKITKYDNNIELQKDPTGFTNNDAIVVSYNSTTRKITLTGTFQAYYKGILVSALINGWESSAHATTLDVTYFLYYDGTNFQFSTTPWTFDQLQIASVQYGTNAKICLKETHGFMPWQTHKEFHETIGTYRLSGGALSNYTLASTTATNRRPDISATVIQDEDLKHTINALTSKTYTQRYLSGAGATRTFVTGASEIIPVNGTVPFYNLNTAGTWSQQPMSNNDYASIFVIAIPVSSDAVSQAYRYLFVQPQSVGSLVSQQNLNTNDINLGDATLLLAEFVFISKIIIKMSGNNWTIEEVVNLSGNRYNQTGSPTGNYLSTVAHDTTLTGSGTSLDPLGVSDEVLSIITPIVFGASTIAIATAPTNSDYYGALPSGEDFGSLIFSIYGEEIYSTFKIMFMQPYDDTKNATLNFVKDTITYNLPIVDTNGTWLKGSDILNYNNILNASPDINNFLKVFNASIGMIQYGENPIMAIVLLNDVTRTPVYIDGSNSMKSLYTPTTDYQVATKKYVDDNINTSNLDLIFQVNDLASLQSALSHNGNNDITKHIFMTNLHWTIDVPALTNIEVHGTNVVHGSLVINNAGNFSISSYTGATENTLIVFGGLSFNSATITNTGSVDLTIYTDILSVENQTITLDTDIILAYQEIYSTGATLTGSITQNDWLRTTYTLPTASTTVLGGVKVDGTTVTINNGVISSVGGGSTVKEVTIATAAATAAKVGTTVGANYTPTKGDVLRVRFSNGCNATSAVTINIDGSGVKNLRLGNVNVTSTFLNTGSDVTVMMWYDGTYYQLFGSYRNDNTTYSVATGAEVDTGTDNAKYVTAKAITDSKLLSETQTVNNLTSTSTILPLSAAQGKALYDASIKNFMVAKVTDPDAADRIYTTTANSYTLVKLDNSSVYSGTKLTFNSTTRSIVIGTGVTQVKVSGFMNLYNWTGLLAMCICKNNDYANARIQFIWATGNNSDQSIPGFTAYENVTAGDTIQMYLYTGSANTSKYIQLTTQLSVEVI